MAMIGHRLAEGLAMMKEDQHRGAGRTTDQMRRAERGALFIAPVGQRTEAGYFMHLAHHLGRDDLRIEPVSVLDNPDRLRGLQFPAVVVDHGAYINNRRGASLDYLTQMLVRRRPSTVA